MDLKMKKQFGEKFLEDDEHNVGEIVEGLIIDQRNYKN